MGYGIMKKDYWLVIGVVALGLYYVLSKKSVSSFNGKKDRYGIESILINI
jgi:hypothetical protein